MDEYGSREIKRSDSAEEENAKKPLVIFGREFSRKQVCAAGAGILCAALLIGGGAYTISHASWTGDSNAPAVSQSKDDEKQDMVLTLEVKADGWDADFYTAIAANKQVNITVGESGSYTVTLIPPVNADGSTYKATSEKVTAVKSDKKTDSTVITLDKVDADKVTKDDLTAIAKDVAEAVKKGDFTLTGDRGAEVVKKFEDNIKKNPNADADAVEKETEKAQETAKEDTSDAKTPETSDGKKDDGKATGSSDNSGNKSNSSSKKDEGKSDSKPSGGNSSNSSSNSNSGSSSKKDDTPAHVHKYDIYHPAVTHTEKVYHPAVTHTEERSICNGCGADITGNERAHAYNALMAGNKACGAYHTVYNTVTDSAAWEETVTITDSAAYYTCSCGARK